jgi:hypothetical protein
VERTPAADASTPNVSADVVPPFVASTEESMLVEKEAKESDAERTGKTKESDAERTGKTEKIDESDAERTGRTEKVDVFASWDVDLLQFVRREPSKLVETSQLDLTRLVKRPTKSSAQVHAERRALLHAWQAERTFQSRTTATPLLFKERDWEVNALNNLALVEKAEESDAERTGKTEKTEKSDAERTGKTEKTEDVTEDVTEELQEESDATRRKLQEESDGSRRKLQEKSDATRELQEDATRELQEESRKLQEKLQGKSRKLQEKPREE